MPGAAEVLSGGPGSRLADRLAAVARTLARGDAEHAAAEAQALADEHPFSPDAWFLLGTALLRLQDARAALPALQRAAHVRPAFAPYQLRLGKAYEACGRREEAQAAFAKATWLSPDDVHAHVSYSRLLFLAGEQEPGYRHLRRGLSLILRRAKRRGAEAALLPVRLPRIAWILIGRRGRGGLRIAALQARAEHALRAGRAQAAASLARSAMHALPDDPSLNAILGRALLKLDQHPVAARPLRTALAARPDDSDLLAAVALAESRTVRQDAAHEHLTRARELGLRSRAAKRQAGFVLLQLGAPGDALGLFGDVLQRDPADAEAAYGHGLAHQSLGHLEEAASWLAKTLELCPTHGAAMWRLALSSQHGHGGLNLERIEALLDEGRLEEQHRMMAHFAAGMLHDAKADHRRAFEHYVAANRLKDVNFDKDAEAQRFEVLKQTFDRRFFERTRGAGVDDPRPVFIVGLPRSGTTLLEQIIASHPGAYGAGEIEDVPRLALDLLPSIHDTAGGHARETELGPHDLEAFGQAYLRGLDRLTKAERVVDKMPMNFLHLGLIAAALPNCRIIHCRRDPMDHCLSMYARHFPGHYPFTYDLENLGLYWRLYADLMAHWRAVLPLPIHEVDYETLVADQEATIRRVLGFCDLPWDPACLAFHANGGLVRTQSFAQVRRPVYRSAVGRWHRFEAELEPLRRALAGEQSSQPAVAAPARNDVGGQVPELAETA